MRIFSTNSPVTTTCPRKYSSPEFRYPLNRRIFSFASRVAFKPSSAVVVGRLWPPAWPLSSILPFLLWCLFRERSCRVRVASAVAARVVERFPPLNPSISPPSPLNSPSAPPTLALPTTGVVGWLGSLPAKELPLAMAGPGTTSVHTDFGRSSGCLEYPWMRSRVVRLVLRVECIVHIGSGPSAGAPFDCAGASVFVGSRVRERVSRS
mmetsp:Transcript_23039/g.61237  ORF Transcript_23039/g.61237 Transcript_23039/m.61237 type:complete len:208 (-) Transcript_23039:264-887(-)